MTPGVDYETLDGINLSGGWFKNTHLLLVRDCYVPKEGSTFRRRMVNTDR